MNRRNNLRRLQMHAQMKDEDKKAFDYLNSTSYLLRLNLNRLGFDVQPITLLNDVIWHVLYGTTVVGTITFRTADDDVTYCNVRLYKYLRDKFKKIDDFIMSEYFVYEADYEKPVRFDFNKFDNYFNRIKSVFPDLTVELENEENVPSINDSISRLTEYCDEIDQKFSKNTHVYDIRNIMNENEKLNNQLKATRDKLIEIMCKIPGSKK